MKNTLWIFMLILVISCTKNIKQNEIINSEILDIIENKIISDEISTTEKTTISWDNYDWITDFDWSLSDGRDYIDPTTEHLYLIGDMAPFVRIFKFELPSDVELYQTRLRNEYFYFIYKNKEKDTLFPLENTSFKSVLDYEFRDHFSILALYMDNGYTFSVQDRVGQQIDPDYPLVGIWGKHPSIREYRLVDPVDCMYYIDINKKFPGFAIREGTYLLKKTGEKEFETVSSFPDGQLRLEFIDDRSLLITPLFTLSEDEEGIVGHLIMSYSPLVPRFMSEE